MKRLLTYLLVTAMLCSMVVVAQADSQSVADAKAAIAALPTAPLPTDPESADYAAAVEAAEDAIWLLAACSEEEMQAIDNYHAPFDLLFTMCLSPIVESAPTQIPTEQTVMEQFLWLIKADTQLSASLPENLYLYRSYTSLVTDPQDPELSQTLGELLYEQAQTALSQVSLRITAYMTTLSTQEQEALYEEFLQMMPPEEEYPSPEEELTQMLAAMPDHLTAENFFEYAEQIREMLLYMEYGHYDFSLLDAETQAHFLVLEEEYQVIAGIYKDDLFAQLDAEILETCDLDRVGGCSSLWIALVEEDVCWALEEKIASLYMIYDCDTYDDLQNLQLFSDYYQLVTGYPYIYDSSYPPDDFWIHGDLNLDYEIDAVDALMALQHAVDIITLPAYAQEAADVNADDTIDAVDALLILQFAVEIIDSFPAMFVA